MVHLQLAEKLAQNWFEGRAQFGGGLTVLILLACYSKTGFKGAVLWLVTPHNVTVAVWIGYFDLSN